MESIDGNLNDPDIKKNNSGHFQCKTYTNDDATTKSDFNDVCFASNCSDCQAHNNFFTVIFAGGDGQIYAHKFGTNK